VIKSNSILLTLGCFFTIKIFCQSLPANYSPLTLTIENSEFCLGTEAGNNKLRVSAKIIDKKKGEPLFFSKELNKIDYTLLLTFQNIYDSYIFIRPAKEGNLSRKGDQIFSGCSFFLQTIRINIDTDAKTFILGPGESKSFRAYTEHDASGYYESSLEKYLEKINEYGDFFEPSGIRFSFSRHYVPYDELESDFDPNDLVDDLEDEISSTPNLDITPDSSELDENDVLNENLSNEYSEFEEYNKDIQARDYDVDFCERIQSSLRKNFEKLYQLTVQGLNGSFNVSSFNQMMSKVQRDVDTFNSSLSYDNISPECYEQIQNIENEYINKFEKQLQKYAREIPSQFNRNSGEVKVSKYLTIPKFTSKTNSAESFNKKTSAPNLKNKKFGKSSLNTSKNNGTIPIKNN
jgi:hypothetical protein